MPNLGETFKEIIDKYGVMQLFGSDGHCACGELYIFGIHIKSHCYKTTADGIIGSCKCPYSGIHIRPDPDIITSDEELKEIAKIFADYISEAYTTDVEIVIEKNK